MAAGTYHFIIEQGATFKRTLTWRDSINNPINITGWTARLQARKSFSLPAYINLTTENGGIVLGGTAGTIQLKITAAGTSALVDLKGIYDLELISPISEVVRLLEGKVSIKQEVTK